MRYHHIYSQVYGGPGNDLVARLMACRSMQTKESEREKEDIYQKDHNVVSSQVWHNY